MSRLQPEQPAQETLARLLASDEYGHSARALLTDFDLAARPDILKVLRALAHSAAHQHTLGRQTRLSLKALNAALVDLETVGLVDTQEGPFGRPLPPSQRLVYRLTDQQLRFFFRFLEQPPQPHSAREDRRQLSFHRPGLSAHLADVVSQEIVQPWLLHGEDRNQWPERIDRAGPLALMDAAHLLGHDHRQHRFLLCGVLSSARQLGVRRVTAWAQAVEAVVHAAGPGWKGRGVLISWSSYFQRARQRAQQTGTWLVDMEEVCLDLEKWLTTQFVAPALAHEAPAFDLSRTRSTPASSRGSQRPR